MCRAYLTFSYVLFADFPASVAPGVNGPRSWGRPENCSRRRHVSPNILQFSKDLNFLLACCLPLSSSVFLSFIFIFIFVSFVFSVAFCLLVCGFAPTRF